MTKQDMDKHVTAVAILHIGFGILGLIIGGLFFVFMTGIGIASQDEEAIVVLSIVGTVFAVFFTVFSIPSIIGGIGLLKRKNWARIVVLILSAIDLLNIPIGTAVGVYSIWALVQDETTQLFTGQAEPPKEVAKPQRRTRKKTTTKKSEG